MTALAYFVYPFGQNADDLTAVPVSAAGDGSVSYYAGWTDPYEYNILTNPAALPIPRGQMNQLFFDITTNLQQYQQYGTPNWITSAQNLGTPFPYPIYARVYYMGIVYENQVPSNTATPGADSSWTPISGNQQGVETGTIIDFVSPIAPSGYLNCDGSAVSRTTYGALWDVISFVQSGVTSNGMNTVTGLSSTANMYVGMAVEGPNIGSTNVASITSSTSITVTATASGSGTVALRFYPWDNGDGGTTFNLPDLRRKSTMGSGGTASTDPLGVGNVVGETGGQESHTQTIAEMPSHNHPPLSGGAFIDTHAASAGGSGTSWSSSSTTGSTGGGSAFNIIQPVAITYKCVKT